MGTEEEISSIQRVEDTEDPIKYLSGREIKAYTKWKKDAIDHLPLALALKLYELFLNGYQCEEICRINGDRFPLGQLIDARLRVRVG